MLRSWMSFTLGPVVLCAVLAVPAPAETIKDKEVGYSIFVPKEFGKNENGGFNAFDFFSDYYRLEMLTSGDRLALKDGWTFSRRIALYYFPTRTAADIAKMKEDREKEKKKEGGADIDVYFSLDRVYQSFEEYAKDKIQGFYFADQKPAKHAGFECTVHEMVFEKLTQVPQRWLACSYKIPGGEFAVVFTCTEQHFKKFKGEMTKTFNSFKLLDAKGLVAKDPHRRIKSNTEIGSDEKVDVDAMTPDEKAAHWAAIKKKAFDQTKSELPKGWDAFETANFLVCHDGDAKTAKESGRHAEAVIAWLSERFGGIGTNPTQAMVLKLFTKSERDSFEFNLPSGDPAAVKTINVYRDWDGKFSLSTVASDVMWTWFNQKNQDLSSRMPWWLRQGLSGMMRETEVKGSKLDFGMNNWERESLAEALRADKDYKGAPEGAPLKPLKLLLTSTGKEIFQDNNWWGEAQCASTVRYFLEGPGSRNEKTRSALQHYVGHLSELVAGVEARLEADRKAAAEQRALEQNMSDEERLKAEDEAYKKKRENEYGKIEQELLDGAFQKTFNGWSDADWKTLDNSWMNFAKSRAKS